MENFGRPVLEASSTAAAMAMVSSNEMLVFIGVAARRAAGRDWRGPHSCLGAFCHGCHR